LLLVVLSLPAMATPSQAEIDKLAAAVRNSCKALAATPRDGARIAAQIGIPLSKADGVTMAQLRNIAFAKAEIRDLKDHPTGASVTFSFKPDSTVRLRDLTKRFGPGEEDHSGEMVTPKFLILPEEGALGAGAARPEGEIDFTVSFKELPGTGGTSCTLSADVLEPNGKPTSTGFVSSIRVGLEGSAH
jgi:hypothetical protein